jgi:hypothetical protein
MDFFQNVLNKNLSKFISVQEAVTKLQQYSPQSSIETVAAALLTLDNLYRCGATACICGLENVVVKENPSRVSHLLIDMANQGFFLSQRDANPKSIGWYRGVFLQELQSNGWPVGDDLSQPNLHPTPPAWFKPYISREYLTLEEASQILVNSNGINKRETHCHQHQLNAYRRMLTEGVRENLISLSASESCNLEDSSDWKLYVWDIRVLCNKNKLTWPIPWNKQPEKKSKSEIDKLRRKTEQLLAEHESLNVILKNSQYRSIKDNEISESVRTLNTAPTEKQFNTRKEKSYNRIIGALVETILGNGPCNRHPDFPSQSALIKYLDSQYDGYDGLSTSSLNRKIPKARELLAMNE